jgi:hypothetical protein
MSCVIALVSVMANIFSLSSVAVAGSSFGIFMGILNYVLSFSYRKAQYQ